MEFFSLFNEILTYKKKIVKIQLTLKIKLVFALPVSRTLFTLALFVFVSLKVSIPINWLINPRTFM